MIHPSSYMALGSYRALRLACDLNMKSRGSCLLMEDLVTLTRLAK